MAQQASFYNMRYVYKNDQIMSVCRNPRYGLTTTALLYVCADDDIAWKSVVQRKLAIPIPFRLVFRVRIVLESLPDLADRVPCEFPRLIGVGRLPQLLHQPRLLS